MATSAPSTNTSTHTFCSDSSSTPSENTPWSSTADVVTRVVTTMKSVSALSNGLVELDPSRTKGLVFDVHASTYGYLAAYTGLLFAFGVINNGVVMALFVRFRSLRSPVNSFLFNLSLSDLIMAGVATPFTFASNVAGRWLFGDAGCTFYGFLVFVGGTEQIVILALLSVHRCVLVTRPLLAMKMTSRWAAFFIVLSWLYSLAVSLPPLFGWNRYTYEGPGTACSIDWISRRTGDFSYIISIFIGVLVIPLTTIITAYTILIRFVKKIAQTQAAQSSDTKADRRVTKMVLLMVIVFLVAWMPYAVFSLFVSFVSDAEVGPVFAILPSFFAKSCAVYNPIIYFLTNKQFKNALIELIFRGRKPFDRDETKPEATREDHLSENIVNSVSDTATSTSTSKRVKRKFPLTVSSTMTAATSVIDLRQTLINSPPVVREEIEMTVKKSTRGLKRSPLSPRCSLPVLSPTPSKTNGRIFEISSKFRNMQLVGRTNDGSIPVGLCSPSPSSCSSPRSAGKRNKIIPVPPVDTLE